MANTTTSSGHFVNIVPDGSTNWDSAVSLPGCKNGVRLLSVKFKPSATNDVLQIRTGTASGPVICYMKDTAGGGVRDVMGTPNGVYCFPYIVASECNFNTAANAIIILEVEY